MADRHQAPAYPLRISAELKEKVQTAAAGSGRSFNAEVAYRLEDSFKSRVDVGDAQFLLAKWSRDLLDAEVEQHQLKLRIGELGSSLMLATRMAAEGDAATDEEIQSWHKEAEEAIKIASPSIDEAMEAVERLKAATEKLVSVVQRRGIIETTAEEGAPKSNPGLDEFDF